MKWLAAFASFTAIFLGSHMLSAAELPPVFERRIDPYERFQPFPLLDQSVIGRVNQIIQDRTGFVWMAGQHGLARFDGFDLQVYTAQNTNGGLPGEIVNCLSLDADGRLWAGTDRGLAHYDMASDSFLTVLKTGIDEGDSLDYHVRAMLFETDSLVWLSMRDGVFGYYNLRRKTFLVKAHHAEVLQPYYPYHTIFRDAAGDIFVGGRGVGPYRYDRQTAELNRLPIASLGDAGGKRDIDLSLIFQDGDGPIWMGALDGLYTYNKSESVFQLYSTGTVYSMIKDRTGAYWVGTGFGAWKIDWKNETLLHYVVNNDFPYSIGGERIIDVFEDRSGKLWFAHENGVSVLLPQKSGVNYYFRIPGYEQSPSSPRVTALEKGNHGKIWVATSDQGLNLFDPADVSFTRFTVDNTNGFISNNIKSLLHIPGQGLYIGFWAGRGFSLLEEGSNKLHTFRYNPDALTQDWYNALASDENGNLYLGFWGGPGLTVFDTHKRQFDKELRLCFADSYNSRLMTSLLRDSQERLWVGTTQTGIHKYLAWADSCVAYYEKFQPNSEFSSSLVYDVVETPSGKIWVAGDDGLYSYDEQSDSFIKTTFRYPFESLLVFRIIPDNEMLWLLTREGIFRYNPRQGVLTDFSMIINLEFRSGLAAGMNLGEGKLLFGGTNGLALVDIKKLGYEHIFPRVFLNFLTTGAGRTLNGLSAKDRLNLKANERFFTVFFGTDEWEPNSSYDYYYRLDKFSTEWIKLDRGQRMANFTNVPPGDYTFRIRTGDRYGNLSAHESLLRISIASPWYLKWWFIVSVILIFVLVVFYFVRTYMKDVSLSMKNMELNQTLLRLQMNPHFIFNSLTAIQNYIYTHKTQQAGEYLSDFSKLIRHILDNSRHEYISLEKEIETMRLYVQLQQLRFKKGFDFEVVVDENLLPDITYVPPMLAQPFIENAIEHGLMTLNGKGKISVKYTLTGKLIRFELNDNGIGLTKSQGRKVKSQPLHHSLSIKICRERLYYLHNRHKTKALLNIEEIIENNEVKGTKVVFDIPFRFMGG